MAGARDELLAKVWARLQRVAASGDLAPVLEPAALSDARSLSQLLDDADAQARLALGWLYWHRHQALPPGAEKARAMDAAIASFVPCFLAGATGLPDALVPELAAQAAPIAVSRLQQAQEGLLRLVAGGTADDAAVSETAELWLRIADVLPAGHPYRAACLMSLGSALQFRFALTKDLADLRAGIEALGAALEILPAGDPERAKCLGNLGNMLIQRFTETGAPSDLDAAVNAARDAVSARSGDQIVRVQSLFGLGVALNLRFEHARRLADLDGAVDALRTVLNAAPADGTLRSTTLSGLGTALLARFEQAGTEADLDGAVEAHREAVTITPAGHIERSNYLSNLGIALVARFQYSAVPADLEEAVKVGRDAAATALPDDPGHAKTLSNLGVTLRLRFARAGDLADLAEAVRTGREALAATPASHPERSTCLANLSGTLQLRFERTSDTADLDEAVQAARDAVAAIQAGHPDRGKYLSVLGTALRTRFERTGQPADLDQAVQAARDALAATAAGHPRRAPLLCNLGAALLSRFERAGALADVDGVVEALTEALTATPSGRPELAAYRSNLGHALRLRFERTGVATDLDAAISAAGDAVAETSADDPSRPRRLCSYGLVLRRRFERAGALADLDEAVAVLAEAAETSPAGHPDRASYLSNLGHALALRSGRTGAQADLDAAATAGQEAVAAIPADHPRRAIYLYNLGGVLHLRAAHTGERADIDVAVEVCRAAAEAFPAGHPARAGTLNNLGSALRLRFTVAGARADVDAAVSAGEDAVAATPADHPDYVMHLTNLGYSLQCRFEATGTLADLNAAVDVCRDAATACPPDYPDQAKSLALLGDALRDRFKRTGAQADLDAAIAAYAQAAEVPSAAPAVRILAAREGAALAAGPEPTRAADLLENAVTLLPEVTPRRLVRGDQQFAIGWQAGLARDAAALALAVPGASDGERTKRALRLLEAGRAVLLSQALDTRSDLTDLRRRHPVLAAQFRDLRDRLDEQSEMPVLITPQPADAEPVNSAVHAVDERRMLAEELSATLRRIRALAGFESFGLPPTIDELFAQAVSGPVVTFNVSEYRSDALILTGNDIFAVSLPGLSHDAVTSHVSAFHQALNATDGNGARDSLPQILEWLWDAAAEPVLDALGYHSAPAPAAEWPRVWWAPGGLMSLLPLHAAGYHGDSPDDLNRRTILDRVVSSYTPTIRALRYSRERHSPAVSGRQALIIAMPTTPGVDGRLQYVTAEAERLRRYFPRVVMLAEPGVASGEPSASVPTKTNVFAHLPECTVAHFACHGTSSPYDPSQSRLLLHDHETDPFTVASLSVLKLDQPQLAYLSACRTAFSGVPELADEAIHLSSAFQLAGFPHVIGTLWEINDAAAVRLAKAFYGSLQADDGTLRTDRVAYALHAAVRTIRDKVPDPYIWAAYVHAGA